eukprot:CAMPEP_0170536896 /NCGR_PEP_ID=MMETSP0209-20121228/102406_1 /TAXON_ID=665100 ORGANISM="Litonotus pictus, Strain P1" /NCGR_SAMPLE_ID=MMETSP0209 /ASSEMBLY_ACC=CAM_ASM_000301 /LENGTH=480 /DNA_ID=CAMNT_0010838313 /DNA_START=269 /DNA_END=1712 /DNA_ORIENTATION=-
MAEENFEKNYTDDGLIYTDLLVIERQREVVTYLVKKIGSHLLKGESVMNISFPVNMFDERSLLDTFAFEQSYASIFLNRAFFCSDFLERLKYVTTYLYSNLHLAVFQTKPFTPIIGESYQCKIGDMDFYLESTVAKPPTINFLGIAKHYKIYGYVSLIEQSYASIFLNKAFFCSDFLERLKYVTTYLYSNLHLAVFQTKPFTPIIGESYQCKIGDMDFYLESTVAKPPTINFLGVAKHYKIYGYVSLMAESGANSVNARKRGNYFVEFTDIDPNTKKATKDIYKLSIPVLLVNGILFGKRIYNLNTPMIVESFTTGLSVFIKFNPDKRGAIASILGMNQKSFPDYVRGFICESGMIKYDPKSLEHKCKAKEKDYKGLVEGEWTHYLSFDKIKYWSKEENQLPAQVKQTFEGTDQLRYVLPSDSTLRNDIRAFKIDDKEESQKWKEKYEQIQRDDRVLRKKRDEILKKEEKERLKEMKKKK